MDWGMSRLGQFKGDGGSQGKSGCIALMDVYGIEEEDMCIIAMCINCMEEQH